MAGWQMSCSESSRRASRCVTRDGSAARELGADLRRWAYYPDWSKDGRWIALSVSPQHHDGEDWDLAIIPADGSRALQALTTGPGNDRLPDWKP